MGTLQRVRNAAPRLVIDTRKYERGLSTLNHDQLHCYVPFRSTSWLSWSACVCMENRAPKYLVNCCTPVADVASRYRRSANLHRLIVPRYRHSTLGRRAFSVGVRPSGIHCLSNCVNRLWATVSFGAHWRRSCSRDTSALSTLRRFAWSCARWIHFDIDIDILGYGQKSFTKHPTP